MVFPLSRNKKTKEILCKVYKTHIFVKSLAKIRKIW